jgi:hypothetical protein
MNDPDFTLEKQEGMLAGCFEGLDSAGVVDHLNRFEGFNYIIISSLYDYRFEMYHSLDGVPDDWHEFWVFDEQIQLHFYKELSCTTNEEITTSWRLVYLGCAQMFPESYRGAQDVINLGRDYEEAEHKVLLRGERNPDQDAWYELKTPRVLDYPWSGTTFPSQVAMLTTTYSLAGKAEFIQFHDLSDW